MNKIIARIDVTILIYIVIGIVFGSAMVKTVLYGVENSIEPKTYLYTITAPNLGTWQTTNRIYYGGSYVKFIIDNQEIEVRTPFVITKEIYAPTNFIADDE